MNSKRIITPNDPMALDTPYLKPFIPAAYADIVAVSIDPYVCKLTFLQVDTGNETFQPVAAIAVPRPVAEKLRDILFSSLHKDTSPSSQKE